MAAGVRAYTVPGRLSAEKRNGASATTDAGAPSLRDARETACCQAWRGKGEPRQLRHICLSDGEWRLNALCSARSEKAVKFQSVRRLSRRLLGRLLRNLFLELA